jgi:chorismate dehydratase
MNLTIGYIPYLNMVPFHQGFGPAPIQEGDLSIQFKTLSPRALGLEAEAGQIDAGAMSMVDTFQLEDRFEPLGNFGIGVKRAAGSVLLFSKKPLSELGGMVAVTDETATSVRLLQVLAEKRYNRTAVSYGRVASSELYDGSAEALLLIGDDALRVRRDGIKGLPVVTDLATEWLVWQGTPFAFARWMVRKELPEIAKKRLEGYLENSLKTTLLDKPSLLNKEGPARGLTPPELEAYWDGFLFRLTSDHDRAVEDFKEALALCLIA